MKKSGVLFVEGIISLIIIMTIVLGISITSKSIKDMYSNYNHKRFRMEFIDMVNMGKFYAVTNSKPCKIRVADNNISLIVGTKDIIKRYKFPSNIRTLSFNGTNNTYLMIKSNGMINKGATFTYSFNGKTNKITIAAVTGKVNYE